MRIREQEEAWLSPLAVRSYETRGRVHDDDECRLRTPFQRDRDRIVHSKAFRRLKHKTQVFIDPNGDHYRTRLTHTLETTGISRGVARALRLNEDLAEAIGFGHDLGHPAFGHAGEEALDAVLRERHGGGGRHSPERRGRRGDALAAVVYVRARVPGRRRQAESGAGARDRARDLRAPDRRRPLRAGRDRLCRWDDRSLRARIRGEARG